MVLLVHQVDVGGFDNNFSYIIYDQTSETGVVVDPTGDISLILAATQDLHVKIIGIYLTHTHFDHTEGIPIIHERIGLVPIYVHTLGKKETSEYENIYLLNDHETINIGEHPITVLHTPGHSDDSICYFVNAIDAESGKPKLISGDTLFVGGCGRTNATRVKDLYESLMEIKALPTETVVYPGHDYGSTPTSTIGHEVKTNKYYLAKNFNEFKNLRLS